MPTLPGVEIPPVAVALAPETKGGPKRELTKAERLELRQGDRRRRWSLKQGAVAAEVAYDPDGGTVGRVYFDPVTGGRHIVSGPSARLKCGRVRYAPTVALTRRGGPGAAITVYGVMRCGNVWACPVCMQARLLAMGEVLKASVAAWHEGAPTSDRAFLLTLTARHHARTDEAKLRDAITGAWREIWQGRDAQEFKESAGLAGWCRRLEVTYGVNGAHPHQHIILVFQDHKSGDERDDIRRWFLDRWRAALARRDFDCDDAHGAHLAPADRAGEYLVKMGLGLALEISSVDSKAGNDGHRTPLEVLDDYARGRRPEDGRLWQQHVRTWRGRRMIEWSRGKLRWKAEPPQAALDLDDGPAIVETIAADEWDAVASRDRFAARLERIEAAEAREREQTWPDWHAHQVARAGLPPAPAPPTRELPRRREPFATTPQRHDWTPPEGESWKMPPWADAYSDADLGELIEAVGLDAFDRPRAPSSQ